MMRRENMLYALGSQTARDGFRNEDDIISKFNNWPSDDEAKKWLEIMGYDLSEIEYVFAQKVFQEKTDVQVQVKVTVKLKSIIDAQNLQVKLVSNDRGYNQVDKFGQQIAEALNTKYDDDVLIKITNTKTQTKKSRFSRWTNNEELFALKDIHTIENKHILLVDDIMTTGSTLEACINVLSHASNVRISVATMAVA